MIDEMKRVGTFTSGIAELTRQRAEQIVKSLLGDQPQERASAMVKQLVDASRENRKELLRMVRSEMSSQVDALGLATKKDLERLERRVARLEVKRSAPPSTRSPKRAAKGDAKKTAARKTTKTSSARKPATAKRAPTDVTPKRREPKT
ncbi:MAG: hypothetical protein H0V97_04465 [Actinobacteria bacterium]|nr:hypothetical protein [Actinomycetota bacterium]